MVLYELKFVIAGRNYKTEVEARNLKQAKKLVIKKMQKIILFTEIKFLSHSISMKEDETVNKFKKMFNMK